MPSALQANSCDFLAIFMFFFSVCCVCNGFAQCMGYIHAVSPNWANECFELTGGTFAKVAIRLGREFINIHVTFMSFLCPCFLCWFLSCVPSRCFVLSWLGLGEVRLSLLGASHWTCPWSRFEFERFAAGSCWCCAAVAGPLAPSCVALFCGHDGDDYIIVASTYIGHIQNRTPYVFTWRFVSRGHYWR